MDAITHVPPLPLRAAPSLRSWLWLAPLVLIVTTATRAGADDTADKDAPPWLRADDRRIAAAVIRGRDYSPTFRAVLDRLAASDLIVYVRRGSLFGRTAASTQLLSSAGGYRYVRVTLELDPLADAGVAMLGHELRHVLELADAPWVVDEPSLLTLYREIGYASCEGATQRCYDTQKAVDTGRQVLVELRRP